MNLFQQLSVASGNPLPTKAKPPQGTSLYAQLSLASHSMKPRHSNKREIADAAWKKAFNGEEMTPPELARRRKLQVEGVFTILLRLERRGMVERCGDRASTGTRRITLWRWIGETEE